MYVSVYMNVGALAGMRCGSLPPEPGVRGSCEPNNVSTGNQTQDCSCLCSQPLSHPSSLPSYFANLLLLRFHQNLFSAICRNTIFCFDFFLVNFVTNGG